MKDQGDSKNYFEVIIDISYQDYNPFYTIYDTETSLLNSTQGKTFLGEKINKICRFCHKDDTQTTFKKQAHIIPEFMGNKKYFSNYECDSCNEFFSRFETALSSYGGILNTFSKIKGKKGYPKHKGIKEGTETYVENDKIVIKINEPVSDDSCSSQKAIIYDQVSRRISVNTNKNSYVPEEAFKALVKIGYCMLNNYSIDDYEMTRNWLLGKAELSPETNNPLLYIYQKIGNAWFPHPGALLFRKKPEFFQLACPTHTLVLFYGLFTFQFYLPGCVQDQWIWEGDKIVLPLDEHLAHTKPGKDNKLEFGVTKIDFSSKELIKNPNQSFSVGRI